MKINNKFVQKLIRLFLAEDFSIQHRLLNLLLLVSGLVGSMSLVITALMGLNENVVGFIAILDASVCIALYLSAVRKKEKTASVFICIAVNVIFFPISYINAGGMNGGTPIWFVLGLMFVWLILRGKICFLVYVINSLIFCFCFLYEVRFPERIQCLSSTYACALDNIQSMLIVSCAFGIVIKYHAFIYERQKKQLLEREEELKRALEDLKHANQSKSDFLANMSHEIRTPINAVLGMDEMILREAKDPGIRHYAANIQSAGNNLLSIINDILDFSKIESGRMEILSADYDLASLLNDCYNMIFMRAKDKGLVIKVENDPDFPKLLRGDEVRIRQIIGNLLTNAVKYTEKGEITLRVGGERLGEEEILLDVEVEDTGSGISPENQKVLFESFKRIDEKKNRNIEGTGLGLAITKQFVELMHGEITVQSELGKGSVFGVKIPQKIVSDDGLGDFYKNYENMGVQTPKYQEKFRAPKARILVVDDVPMNLEVFKALLKKTKVHVDVAESGLECLEKIQNTKYHIIFMDHMMPEPDGVETLQKMMQDKTHLNQDTPVIALTANAILGVREQYLGYGFQDYISKPIKSAELERMILQYLPEECIEFQSDKMSEGTAIDASSDLMNQMKHAFMEGENIRFLEQYFFQERYEEYRQELLSLKRMARSVGAEELADFAREMEHAVKERSISYIKENHRTLISLYKNTLTAISRGDI